MSERYSWQLQIKGPEGEQLLRLPEGETTIGRRPQNDIVLAHQFVSGRHAQLTCTPTGCTLTDLESTNGTTLNGEPVEPGVPLPLAPGSEIVIGPFSLTLAGTPLPAEEPAEDMVPEPAEDVAPEPAEDVVPEPEAEETAEPAAEEVPEPAEEPAAEPVPDPVEEGATTAAEAIHQAGSVPPPPPPAANGNILHPDPAEPLPGLGRRSRRLLPYLPGIYHTDFMGRFLAIFESILTPVEWTVDNFDLFLSPRTAPVDFLPWLANWYTITYDGSWSEAQRRALLADAPQIYARRGTRWALARVLEIYTGRAPEIIEFEDDDEPFSFTVHLPFPREALNVTLLEQIIDAHKPAHTIYRLRFGGE